MTEIEFRQLAAAGYNRIPLHLETLADLDTPLSIYLKLANRPGSYLLESVIGGERFGRYSIVGLPARERLEVTGNRVSVIRDGVARDAGEYQDPLAYIDEYLASFRAAPLTASLRFAGGVAGYFGYETVRYIEPRLRGRAKPDPLGLPDIRLLLSDELAVVDNLSGKLHLIVYVDPSRPDAHAQGEARLHELRLKLRDKVGLPPHPPQPPHEAPRSNIGEAAFHAAVARCKDYITEGDIMQVQVSQRLTQRLPASPVNLYRALRSINPSPYMFYFDFGDCQLVGASPEILVRREGDKVTLRPIAGTRKRGATPEKDAAMERELVSDPKERAEHLMLIDLGRNDVGRIAKTGSVKVTETMVVERYSHVMHMVSNVEGAVDSKLTPMELLRATFPAGTVTGTPKVRAMEIIDELEPEKRSVYAGAVGYIGFQGNIDLAIAIRTGVVKDGNLYVQAAAGSLPTPSAESEWRETQNKARAVLAARSRSMPASTSRSIEGRHDPHDRQLRFVHLQPGAIPGRARAARSASCATTSSPVDEIEKLAPERVRSFPRPLHAERSRRLARAHPAHGGSRADSRRVPRPPGDRAGLRRQGRAREDVDARQGVGDPSHRRGCLPGIAHALQCNALSLARDRTRDVPSRPGGDGVDRGRRDHGRAPPDAPDRGRAVPPRIDPHRARPRAAQQFPRHMKEATMFTPHEAINRLCDKREIFFDEMVDLMRQVMEGKVSQVQLAAILMGPAREDESVSEIAAAAQVMREFSTRVDASGLDHLVDTCGTGGDKSHTFNISTTAAFVAAAAGARVAKHGNRSVSSKSGQRRRARALGVNLATTPSRWPFAFAKWGGFHVRAQPPPGDEARGSGAQGSGHAHDPQHPRAAHQSGRRAEPGDGGLPCGPRRDPGRVLKMLGSRT
jgi:anthranilate synthase component 1